jgi:hypothetical protein
MISISACRAQENESLWRGYNEGHAQVLRDFGIDVLTSHGDIWLKNPSVFVIVARNQSEEIIGGIKLHKVNEGFRLPVEEAIGYLNPEISQIIEANKIFGVGEICGLWISKNAGRQGLAYYLTKVAMALCEPVEITKIYGISSPFTLNMFLQTGYNVMLNMGDQGNYEYPTKEFISTAVEIQDAINLPLALETHRNRVFSLRSQPVQRATEAQNGHFVEIQYNLSEVCAVRGAYEKKTAL